MKHLVNLVTIGFALAVAIPSAPAQAQFQHTFVSSTGSDANNCTLAAPCRHLQTALAATLAGGEINILDSAGYNNATTVTIDKAISIVAPLGIEAQLAPPSGGAAIVINAGASDAVSLRGLTIDGGGISGTTGIQFNTGASLTVQNCVIRHMSFTTGITGTGIVFTPNATSKLTVSNSLVADNVLYGIIVGPSGSGTVTAIFNRVEVNNNGGDGIDVSGQNSTGLVKAVMYDSISAGNAVTGFGAFSGAAHAPTTMTVVRSVTANNGNGLLASGVGATLRVVNSTVTGNQIGWNVLLSGVVASYGNNSIDDNESNSGSLTPVALQ